MVISLNLNIFNYFNLGNAQAFTFVFTFLMSAVGSLVVSILKLVPTSRSGAKIAQYFFRVFSPFCFGFGILNVAK